MTLHKCYGAPFIILLSQYIYCVLNTCGVKDCNQSSQLYHNYIHGLNLLSNIVKLDIDKQKVFPQSQTT